MRTANGTSDSVKLTPTGMELLEKLIDHEDALADREKRPRYKKNAIVEMAIRSACIDRGLLKKGGK